MSEIESLERPLDITSDQVADYLKSHPDYFHQRDDLLMNLSIPHQRGDSVSLVEKQVCLLRERNLEMRQRLNQLLDVARDNDRLFDKTRRLVLQMLEATELDGLALSVEDSLLQDYQVPFCKLILIGDVANDPNAGSYRLITQKETKPVQELLRKNRAVCGALRSLELSFLFQEQAYQVKSAAVTPLLLDGRLLGILAIGSHDPQQYRSSVGTLFLSYVGDAMARLLPRHM